MKYLQSYKIFESNTNNIYAKSFTKDEFFKVLYDEDKHDMKDPSIINRIRFFNWQDDFGWRDNKYYYSVLFDGDKVIGVCKIGHYDMSERGKDKNYMSISYCSIDKEYQNKGYLKFMIIELVKFCKEKGFDLGSSAWTVPGNVKLRPLVKKYSKEYGVDFLDHNRKHDREWMYNADMKSIEDMTEEEREKFDKVRHIEPDKKGIFNWFKYDTGKYKIFSTKTSYDKEEINKIFQDIDNDEYNFHSPSGTIAGYIHDDIYYITDGNHKILAALRYWYRYNNYLPVEKLIKNGMFTNKRPDSIRGLIIRKFPKKLFQQSKYK